MRTIEYLTDPALGPLYYPGLVTAVLVTLLCAPLSVFVVLKRLAFVGQGVSHAAFGGVGVAVLVAATTGAGLSPGGAAAGWGVAAVLRVAPPPRPPVRRAHDAARGHGDRACARGQHGPRARAAPQGRCAGGRRGSAGAAEP